MAIAETAHSQKSPSSDSAIARDDVPQELLTVEEAAQFLKVPVSWVYEHVRSAAEDRLPVLKLGKYLRFDMRDLSEYIDAKRQASRHGRRRR
jgi:excisionase family DNA binding protein